MMMMMVFASLDHYTTLVGLWVFKTHLGFTQAIFVSFERTILGSHFYSLVKWVQLSIDTPVKWHAPDLEYEMQGSQSVGSNTHL